MAYNAQHFTENKHLGDDLNGIGGETATWATRFTRSQTVTSCSRATVALAGANIVILLHAYLENGERKYVQSYYGHVQDMLVRPGDLVKHGQQIATVGTANGRYFAHLHFEMREFLTPFIGAGYREDTRGWLNPTKFIEQHR